MDITNLPITLSSDFLQRTSARAQVGPRVFLPSLPGGRTSRTSARWASLAAHPALRVVPGACSAPTPPPPGPLRARPLHAPPRSAATALGGAGISSRGPSRLHGDAAASQAPGSGCCASGKLGWPAAVTASRLFSIPAGGGPGRSAPKPEPATLSGSPDWPPSRRPRSLGPEFYIPEIPRNYLDKKDAVKAPKTRHNGKFLVFDPKEKVMMEPNEAMSNFFGCRPRLADKVCISPTQDSLNVAKTFLEKMAISSKKIEDKVSLRNTENRISSKSIENKDNVINQQSNIWSPSFIKEITGEGSQDTGLAKEEKVSENCHQDIDDKLSESTDEDEDDPNDEDDKGSNPQKKTQAPLELMAEFLRAEMCRDYQLAKKLCQMKKSQNVEEEDDNDSDEDSSSDSEEESSKNGSDDSSDHCEDGS